MKKLMYVLLVLAYVTVAYLSVHVLPHYYFGAIMGGRQVPVLVLVSNSSRKCKLVLTNPC